MSLTSDLKSPDTPVGRWARKTFPAARTIYPMLNAAPVVRPDGWGDGRDQRWSWAGMACDTMIRWQLGVTGPCGQALAGARLLQRRVELTGDLARLLDAAPALDDTAAAARIAILWAMAEQHARYGLTVNPLTAIGDQPADVLLTAVPDEVVDDVAAVMDGPAAGFASQLGRLGPITAGIAFRYPGGADLDLVAGSTLVEIKTKVKRLGFADVTQPVGYALLAEPGQIDQLAWVLPRSGKHHIASLERIVTQITDDPAVTVDMLRAGLAEAAEL